MPKLLVACVTGCCFYFGTFLSVMFVKFSFFLYLRQKIFIMSEIVQKFKIGDVVTLKTGSPKMTITEIELHSKTKSFKGFVLCQWFNNELKEIKIQQDALDLVIE